MTTPLDLAGLREKAERATPGPWHWEMSPKHRSISLRGHGLVMDFVRWGMNKATPRFRDGHVMECASVFGVPAPGREHHAAWHQEVNHADAIFIAAASPSVVLALVERLERAERERDGFRDALDSIEGGHPCDEEHREMARAALTPTPTGGDDE